MEKGSLWGLCARINPSSRLDSRPAALLSLLIPSPPLWASRPPKSGVLSLWALRSDLSIFPMSTQKTWGSDGSETKTSGCPSAAGETETTPDLSDGKKGARTLLLLRLEFPLSRFSVKAGVIEFHGWTSNSPLAERRGRPPTSLRGAVFQSGQLFDLPDCLRRFPLFPSGVE